MITDWRLSNARVQSLGQCSKLVTVERLARTPCCCPLSNLWHCKYSNSCLLMTRSEACEPLGVCWCRGRVVCREILSSSTSTSPATWRQSSPPSQQLASSFTSEGRHWLTLISYCRSVVTTTLLQNLLEPLAHPRPSASSWSLLHSLIHIRVKQIDKRQLNTMR